MGEICGSMCNDLLESRRRLKPPLVMHGPDCHRRAINRFDRQGHSPHLTTQLQKGRIWIMNDGWPTHLASALSTTEVTPI